MTRKPLDTASPGARIVFEEQKLLGKVQFVLAQRAESNEGQQRAATDYDSALVELRDLLAEAKPEDLAPLVEQMTRIAALAAGRRREGTLPVDPASPYFAHMRLRDPEGKVPATKAAPLRVRDILIGRRGFIDRDNGVHIVDWRDAPVSQIYYRYEEGDDYDETLDDRHLEGFVEARRNVTIHAGALRRVGCPQGVFVADAEGHWFEAEGHAAPVLQGGSGKAARPPRPTVQPPRDRRHLGVHGDAIPRADKHLPEIAALIDPDQFDLITAPEAGLVVIQGGAGSGKTTVALHRVAFLVFRDPQRFRPGKCLVVVPSLALERYVEGVLPALGVRGVPVVTFAGWARATRRKVLPRIADRYTDDTPANVARVKKHPALLDVLRRAVDDRLAEAEKALHDAAHTDAGRAAVTWVLRDLAGEPPVDRLAQVARWLHRHQTLDGADRQRLEITLTRERRRLRDLQTLWSEVLTDVGRLRAALPREGPDAVSDREIRDVVEWVAHQQEEELEEELGDVDPEARVPVDGGRLDDTDRGRAAGRLDAEDDAILLRLFQLLHGGLFKDGDHNSPIDYDHVAIDEAQDFSAVEIQVMVDAVVRREVPRAPGDTSERKDTRSITICGDVAQRLVFDNAFHGWHELLGEIGLTGFEVRPLSLSYRSTEEVMRFARAVLGPLADRETPAARPGAPVELHRFDAMGEAVGFLAEALRSLAGREPSASIALIARHPAQADAWYQALSRTEVPSLRRVRRQDFSFAAGVDVTDIAQVKGLEFDYVVLLDASASNYPDLIEARHLLHIGATRAAHQLWLLVVGNPSPLVPPELMAEEQW